MFVQLFYFFKIPTRAQVTGCLPSAGSWPARSNEGLAEALTGAKVVVIPAGVPRKPGMTRDDLFNVSTVL
jgi:malate dehydrogenase